VEIISQPVLVPALVALNTPSVGIGWAC
jgi:hypothetical protein